ncbi:MAG: hypothetical protein AVDCRST_MAG30-119 [uncultured Solirubrobacteraceae bacterium]|uniref:Uncharacterized protein n=1 Tax=uncultured Solirubrobacteraceae bacterium TaxID=1162706 RepID=A0A6J4RDU3_9ACTN|nr:MAG: hypothetical protein AVDCRST_MAG30-119 [uncultured Solirubrobacteraceae bacterium]
MPRLLVTLLAFAALVAVPSGAAAQAPAPADPGGALVYVFVLDGLDGDRVDRGGAPFLSSLMAGQADARSTYFRESRAIMIAETNPNHVAMATGAYGNRSGIPGNAFAVYGRPPDGDSCPDGPLDESKPPVETSGESPSCLRAETMFATAQRGPDPGRIVTAGIFGKPKLSRIFAGKADPQRFDADYLWTPCVRQDDDTPYCKQVPNRVFDEYALLDATVMDEVLRTVRQGVPGDGRTFTGGGSRPNLTFVNFPGVDNSGHGTGAGAEYDRAILSADDEIERFVAQQKQLGLWNRTVMVVLSDHSMDSTPEKTTLAQRFNAAGISSSAYEIVQNGSAALVYLTNRTSPDRFTLLKRMREAATNGANPLSQLAGPPAVEALYREPNPADGDQANTLDGRHPAWRLTGERTGDLVVYSQSNTSFNDPINPLAGNHGGPQTRDNFFAVVGGSDLVNQRAIEGAQDPLFDDTERNPAQAENVDVAPTVMRLLGRPAPAQSEGRFLAEAFRADRLAPQVVPRPVVPGTGPGPAPTPTPGAGDPPASGCAAASGFVSATAAGSGRGGLRFAFARRTRSPVTVDVFQSSVGSRILGNRRVARFTRRTRPFRWTGRRGLRDGFYFARLSVRGASGRTDTRRVALERRNGRFVKRPSFYRRASCDAVSSFKLEAPVFGGRTNRAMGVSYRLSAAGRVTVELLRGRRVVRTLSRASTRSARRTFRLRVGAEGLRRGDHRVRLRVTSGGRTTTTALTARRL